MRRALSGLLAIALVALALIIVAMPAEAAPATKGYLIGSKAPLTQAQADQLKAAGVSLKHVYKNFGGAAGSMSDKAVAQVRALPFVTSVNEDNLKQLDGVQVAPLAVAPAALPNEPYWLDMMDAEKNSAYDGSGVWVAVLDSGFYPNWRDYFNPGSILTDKANAFIAANGNQNVNQWDRGSDPHGMAVAATIVGYTLRDDTNEGGFGAGYATGAPGTYFVPGVATGAKIIPIKVCEPIGCFGSAINAGVDYVTSLKKANPAQPIVINESLGGSTLDPVEKAAIDAAVKSGVVMVASAGNSGDAGMGFPGAYEPVIGVGAGGWKKQWYAHPSKTWWLEDVPEDILSQYYIPSFSSREITAKGQHLDVVAPGRYMLLPYPCTNLYRDDVVLSPNRTSCASKASPDNATSAPYQYIFMSGTSFSAPATAGVVALMLQKNPTLSNADANVKTYATYTTATPGQVERILEDTAQDLGPGTANIRHRTGAPLTETWGANAVGKGWVLIDKALAAV